MGRAIVRKAAAFLFDEPLSNLDAKLRGQMRTEIARMQQRLGTTTVYVTHDQTEAMTLGDRIAVLRKGLLQQVGSPHQLYEQPVNLFVAGFIGSPPMNFVLADSPVASSRRQRHPCGRERPDAACRRARPGDPGDPAAGLRGCVAAVGREAPAGPDVQSHGRRDRVAQERAVYAYVPYEAPAAVTDQLREQARARQRAAARG